MKILKIVGAGWAIMGALNIAILVLRLGNTTSAGISAIGIIISMFVFVFPGLSLYARGKRGEER